MPSWLAIEDVKSSSEFGSRDSGSDSDDWDSDASDDSNDTDSSEDGSDSDSDDDEMNSEDDRDSLNSSMTEDDDIYKRARSDDDFDDDLPPVDSNALVPYSPSAMELRPRKFIRYDDQLVHVIAAVPLASIMTHLSIQDRLDSHNFCGIINSAINAITRRVEHSSLATEQVETINPSTTLDSV